MSSIDIFRWGTHLYMSLFPSVCSSVAYHVSGTVDHVIIIFDTRVKCSHLFKIMIFWVVRGVKGQKIAPNKKKELHPSHIVSQEQCSI